MQQAPIDSQVTYFQLLKTISTIKKLINTISTIKKLINIIIYPLRKNALTFLNSLKYTRIHHNDCKRKFYTYFLNINIKS